MMISSRGRYALRVMLDMAEHGGGEWLCLRDIAQRQQLSKKYLESIMAALNRAGLVEGTVGRKVSGGRNSTGGGGRPVAHIMPVRRGHRLRQLLRLRRPTFLAGVGGSDQFLYRQPYIGAVHARQRKNTGQCGAERR